MISYLNIEYMLFTQPEHCLLLGGCAHRHTHTNTHTHTHTHTGNGIVYVTVLLYVYYFGLMDHSGIKMTSWFPWQPDTMFHDNQHKYANLITQTIVFV